MATPIFTTGKFWNFKIMANILMLGIIIGDFETNESIPSLIFMLWTTVFNHDG